LRRQKHGALSPKTSLREGFAEMLRETRGALVASGAADGDASFEATAAISLPRACRPVPPRSSAKTADAPADLASMAVGFASALAFGRAIPPAPPTEDGLTAPAAWHPSRPVLATVDGEGQVLIHHDPARRSRPGTPADANQTHQTSPENATTTALRHASHARARALAWRPRAGATLAVERPGRFRRGGRRVKRVRRRQKGRIEIGAESNAPATVALPPPSRRTRRRFNRRYRGPVSSRGGLDFLFVRRRRDRRLRKRPRRDRGAHKRHRVAGKSRRDAKFRDASHKSFFSVSPRRSLFRSRRIE
jgi:hypothetical protein